MITSEPRQRQRGERGRLSRQATKEKNDWGIWESSEWNPAWKTPRMNSEGEKKVMLILITRNASEARATGKPEI